MSFEEDDSSSESLPSLIDESGSDLSSEEEGPEGDMKEIGVQPYMFEPEWPSSDSVGGSGEQQDRGSGEAEAVNEDRTVNSDWCQCENCQRMDRNVECVCCQEIPQIVDKNHEYEVDGPRPSCITLHPGFSAVCLNKWVLEAAWYQYKHQYAESYNGPEHKLRRHIAYRQLLTDRHIAYRHCLQTVGLLGKEIRVVLPSCAVFVLTFLSLVLRRSSSLKVSIFLMSN